MPCPNEILKIAIAYVEAGVSVIPLRTDGSKKPAIPSWKPYQQKLATEADLQSWFQHTRYGIGIVCGVVSGGLEVLDFDERPDETFFAWWDRLSPATRAGLGVCETGGGGFHVIYRCTEVCGNHKIAMTEGRQVLVESRGEGGYIVGVGSPIETHKDLQPYVQVMGCALPTIQSIDLEARREMWLTASAFDESNLVRELRREARERDHRSKALLNASSSEDAPWTDFDRRAAWDDILEPAGWESPDGVFWSRPGKGYGTSAKVCLANSGNEVLVVFSTNAGPLSPGACGHRTWGKFDAYVALYHNGNRSAACKSVLQQGFGSHIS